MWTVSDDLRVRSKPRVSADSLKYQPLLPLGTELFVIDGPVAGSDYWWYKVRLEAVVLNGGITSGWVAAGDHDGTPWIGSPPDSDAIPEPDVLPELPTPALLLEGTEEYVGSDGNPYVRYEMTVVNWDAYPGELFEPAPDLEPCGLNANASRTWVHIIDADAEDYIYGFCALGEPQDLTGIWFAVPAGTAPPSGVYVLLWDRLTDRIIESNIVRPIAPA